MVKSLYDTSAQNLQREGIESFNLSKKDDPTLKPIIQLTSQSQEKEGVATCRYYTQQTR